MDSYASREGAAEAYAMGDAFPGAVHYARMLLPRGRAVRESPDSVSAFPYSERHLQCVWADAQHRPAVLHASDGEEVRVLDPGRWNLEAGPDFLDAHLVAEPGHRHLRGDVEIHVRPADWEHHGHGADARYANVAAHVCFSAGVLAAGALPPGALQISLRKDLLVNPAFSFENIDVTAYPFARPPDRVLPCAALLAQWPPSAHAAVLNAAGEERLRRKAIRMRADIAERGAEQTLYEDTLAALGYKHNRAACRLLARTAPIALLREQAGSDPIAAYAILLGAAGLLPMQIEARWDEGTRAFVRGLWHHWWKRRSAWDRLVLPPAAWHLANLRPHNHPTRRLAAAAGLFVGPHPLVDALPNLSATDPEEWFRQARALLDPPAALSYWQNRLSLGGRRQKGEIALVGEGRLAAVLSNVVIPFLAATGWPIAPLLPHLPAEEDNSLIRHTAHALFGRDHNPAVYNDGLKQQGLMQVFHDFCLNNRSACVDCAFTAALADCPPAAAAST